MNLRFITNWLAILALGFFLGGCAKKPAASGGWTADNSQRGKLSDYQGKVVVIDFYATWCEPCRAEIPHLIRLQKQYADQGLQVIGLNVGGDEDRAAVPAFAKQLGISYPLAFPDDDVVDRYLSDNQNIPQAFLFDRQGKLVKRFIGYSSDSAAELDAAIRAAVEGPASGKPQS